MTSTRILVVGEALIDAVPDTDGRPRRLPGGSPTNVAVGLARLGHDVTELTTVGRDADGEIVRAHLRESGVRMHRESVISDATSVANVTFTEDGDANYDFDVTWQVPPTLRYDDFDLIHTGSIALALEPGASNLLEVIRRRPGHMRVTVDPNVRAQFLQREQARERLEPFFREADLVKLSQEDSAFLYPDLDDLDLVLEQILGLGVQLAVITMGSRGAILANRTSRQWVPAVADHVVDTIGAGDSFMVGLIDVVIRTNAGWGSEGESLYRFGKHASRLAALTVGRQGAYLPWRHELDPV